MYTPTRRRLTDSRKHYQIKKRQQNQQLLSEPQVENLRLHFVKGISMVVASSVIASCKLQKLTIVHQCTDKTYKKDLHKISKMADRNSIELELVLCQRESMQDESRLDMVSDVATSSSGSRASGFPGGRLWVRIPAMHACSVRTDAACIKNHLKLCLF